ncbi:MAG: DUF502 domain-containing protein [SAR202 cluster bacterium]|nr:DUF502 domain-containing protein [SAR202 cluster bacterium]
MMTQEEPRPTRAVGRMGNHIRERMVSGLLVILPLAATYLVLKFVFDLIDPNLRKIIERIFGRDIPGVGLVLFFIIIYLAGVIASYVIGRRIIDFGHHLADLIPIVRPIYRTARQTVDALSNAQGSFRYSRVVMVEWPRQGLKTIGFVTASYVDPGNRPMTVVYIPNSPLPNSGWIAVLPEEEVTHTNLSVDEAMRMVLSAGSVLPEHIKDYGATQVVSKATQDADAREASNH